MTLTNTKPGLVTNKLVAQIDDTHLWVEAAPFQARLSADGWTLKQKSHVYQNVRHYHCTVWRLGLQWGLKGKGLTPLLAMRAAYRTACETPPPNKFVIPEEWKVHL